MPMTRTAQRYQIEFCIVSKVTAEGLVMYLQILCSSAILAPPTIATQHLQSELCVSVGCQLNSFPLRLGICQDAFPIAC
jgi:hypothetical protein